MPSPQNREELLVAAALKMPVDKRDAFLRGACLGEDALRQRLDTLLAAHEELDELSPKDAPAARATIKLDLAEIEDEAIGTVIGRYKILERVGEGGCGVVYVAEQTEPVRRRVALKVIKLGMDTKQVVARFEAERQALAMMDHPNIAKVLDAGATENGRPYFVMELVRGIKITDYCDQSKLTTKDRLDLFIKVCQAIQHAHQKGIIHRDIKPSNILVTLHDGVPVPKVIDFGIAKATEGRLTDATVYTQLNQFIGTPAYMSPEQAEMSGLDIDTRSDIYSLGVLLYELLAGSTPFDPNELMSQGIDAMRKTIREKEPVRPSTRVATLKGEELTTTAKRRSADKSKLQHQLKGDLDWIVMKCLEKDRTRRYETANGLAFDIKRHLNNEPVLARPPSAAYRLQKAWRRNKTAFAAAALMAAVLVAATGISAWQAQRALRAEHEQTRLRNEAEAESRKAKSEAARAQAAETLAKQRLAESEAISQFLTEVFQSPDPSRDGRTITVAETLGTAARKLETDLADQPARRANLQATLGWTYHTLGLYPEAIALEEKVQTYHLTVSGPENLDTLLAMHRLASSYDLAGRHGEALQLEEEVVARYRKATGPENPNALWAMMTLSAFYREARRLDESMKLREEVLALSRKVNGLEHPQTILAMDAVAGSYARAGREDEALRLQEEVLALSRKVSGPEHPHTLLAMNHLAGSYAAAGRTDEALKLLEEALPLSRKVLGSEHPDTLMAMNNLASVYYNAARRDEALKLGEEVLALSLKKGPNSQATSTAFANLGFTLDALGRGDEAIKAWQEAVRIAPSGTANIHYWLGKALVDRQRYVEALPILRATQKFYPDGDRGQETAERLALAEAMEGGQDPKSGALDRILAALRQTVAANPADTDKARRLATVYLWLGQTNDHQAICRRLLDLAANSKEPTAHERAAKAYLIQAHPDSETLKQAVASGRQALQLAATNDVNRPWFLVTAAMAAVRDGKPGEAEPLLNEALKVSSDGDQRGLALAYRSLARAHLGRSEEARADFAELEKLLPKFPAPPALSAILMQPDSMAVCLAHDEAKALLNPPPSRSKP